MTIKHCALAALLSTIISSAYAAQDTPDTTSKAQTTNSETSIKNPSLNSDLLRQMTDKALRAALVGRCC